MRSPSSLDLVRSIKRYLLSMCSKPYPLLLSAEIDYGRIIFIALNESSVVVNYNHGLIVDENSYNSPYIYFSFL